MQRSSQRSTFKFDRFFPRHTSRLMGKLSVVGKHVIKQLQKKKQRAYDKKLEREE